MVVPRAAGTALLGLLLLLTAAIFDAEPLYVPGTAFLALAAGAVAWVVAGARGVQVTRTVDARRVLEEQPVLLSLRVRPGGVGLPAGELRDDLLPQPAPLPTGRDGAVIDIQARFGRRGRKVLSPPRVIVRDPFGLVARTVVTGGPDEVLVLPRLEPVRSPRTADGGVGAATRRGRPTFAAEVDLDGLRPHREGVPASRIFWPALARGGELMDRRLRAEGDTLPLVVLDPRAPEADEDLDAAVRAAASLSVHLAKRGGCALLLPGDRRPSGLDATLAGWTALHVRLALLGAGAGPALGGLASRRGPVLFVAARRGARAPRALAQGAGGERVLVVPGALSGRRAVLEVAGCTGYDLVERHVRPRRRLRPETVT